MNACASTSSLYYYILLISSLVDYSFLSLTCQVTVTEDKNNHFIQFSMTRLEQSCRKCCKTQVGTSIAHDGQQGVGMFSPEERKTKVENNVAIERNGIFFFNKNIILKG